jgi:hypothetical protein
MTNITIPRAVVEQALEALESGLLIPHSAEVFTALRAALAQQAEPVATHSTECWRWHHKCAVAKIERECKHD